VVIVYLLASSVAQLMARLGVTEGEKVYLEGNEVKDKLKNTDNEVTLERR
jgi:hypothetical protein